MAVGYLKSLTIETNEAGIFSTDYSYLADPVERDQSSRMYAIKNCLRTVSAFLETALKQARIEMKAPPTQEVCVVLSRSPQLDWPNRKNVKCLVRNYDPLRLLDIPYDAKSYGDFAIECWHWAAGQLRAETDFPEQFVIKTLERFRQNGYADHRTLSPQGIAGSKAKARIFGAISCVDTVLEIEVSYRGKPMFTRTIWEAASPAWVIAFRKRNILVEDGRLQVRGQMSSDPIPAVSFRLDSLPEEFRQTQST